MRPALKAISALYSLLALCTAISGCAIRPQRIPSGIGPDFPSSDSYYPSHAEEFGREGTTTVHYCVDAKGYLVEAPTVAQSSGSGELDDAALKLARAGTGHYRPATADGQPVPDCDTFKVKFELRVDPRFPTLSRREHLVTAEYRSLIEREITDLKSVARPPNLSEFDPGNPEQINQLTRFADSAGPVLRQFATTVSQLVSKIDELGRSDDVTEAERAAFSQHWQPQRADLIGMREATLDMQGLVFTITELASYVQALRGASRNPADPLSVSPGEHQNIDLIIRRGRDSFTRIQPLIGRLYSRQANAAAEHQNSPSLGSLATQRPPMELISVEGNQYAPTLMPDVLAPRPVNRPNDPPKPCQYPETVMPTLAEGSTVVRLLIDAAGRTSDESVVRPSGSDELDSAALQCMSTRQFQPARRDSEPVIRDRIHDYLESRLGPIQCQVLPGHQDRHREQTHTIASRQG